MSRFLYLFLTCSALFSSVLIAMPVDKPVVINEIVSKNLKTRFENKEELFNYLSSAIDLPWILDYNNTKGIYGKDNTYIKTLLNNFQEKNYLSSYEVDIAATQQKSQIDYLLYVIEKVDYRDDSKNDIINLVEYLKTVVPNQNHFNFAQRLNLYTKYIQNSDNTNWLDVLFFEEEKETVILFINRIEHK